MIETREVEFRGDQLIGIRVVEDGRDTAYVPIRRLCENLRLDYSTQLQKIKGRRVLAKGMGLIPTPTQTGPQDMACLRYDLIPTWLMLVHPDKVAAEVREKLEAYQEEVSQVLAAYFLGSGIAVNEQRATPQDVYLKALEMQVEISRNEAAAVRGRAITQLMEKWGGDLREEERRLLLLSAGGVQAPKVAWIEADEIANVVSKATGANVMGQFVGRLAKAMAMQPLENQERNHWAIRQRTPAKGVEGKRVDQVVYLDAGARRLQELATRAVQANLAANRPAMSPKGIDEIRLAVTAQ